ncbi:amidohydrolase family protein [Rhodococcus sp. NPDC003322]
MALDIHNPDVESQGRGLVRSEPTFLSDPAPRELWCPLVSVDDHVLEPADIFTSRTSSRYRDLVPTVVPDQHGIPYWHIDGDRIPMRLTMCGAVGRPIEEWSLAPQKYEDFRPGVWDVHSRVKDMDLNGVYASLNFPSFVWGFAGKRLSGMRDHEAGLASVRAYNDWMLEEWCGAYPDRFISCQLPWLLDPEVAAMEIRSNKERGFQSVTFSENPEGLGLPSLYSEYWDPFFRACEETETVVNLHVGSSGSICQPSAASPADVTVALFPLNSIQAVVDWIFSRIPLRFPKLKIVLSESGVSWVPMIIERLTRSYRQAASSNTWSTSDPDPVDILRRNFWFTSIEDPAAFRMLDIIGVEKVMVETDYPHADSSWPDSQELFSRDMKSLPRDTVEKLCFRNASALYKHPLPPTGLIDSSLISES